MSEFKIRHVVPDKMTRLIYTTTSRFDWYMTWERKPWPFKVWIDPAPAIDPQWEPEESD